MQTYDIRFVNWSTGEIVEQYSVSSKTGHASAVRDNFLRRMRRHDRLNKGDKYTVTIYEHTGLRAPGFDSTSPEEEHLRAVMLDLRDAVHAIGVHYLSACVIDDYTRYYTINEGDDYRPSVKGSTLLEGSTRKEDNAHWH